MDVWRDKPMTNPSTPPSRIGALATLPVFLKLDGKRVVVAGGSEAALWKAELLAAAGASVEIYAETYFDGFESLASAPTSGRIALNSRKWRSDDFAGAALAVGAITETDEAERFVVAARASSVPVNIVDRPELCDFQFGAIVNRSPLVVGISTDGAAPVLAQAVRSLVETLLPAGVRHWLDAAKAWRGEGDRLGVTTADRRRFWDLFATRALTETERRPKPSDLDELLASAQASQPGDRQGGHVRIVMLSHSGAEAVTLGAMRELRLAEVIFYDESIPETVLDLARREARRVPVASSMIAGPSSPVVLLQSMIEAVTNGRRVLRLKAAASSSEGVEAEAENLRAAGLLVSIIASNVLTARVANPALS